jgi:hypothetical protein
MRFPRWIIRPWALSLAVAAALAGVGCWAWVRLDARLDVTLGPGARFSARLAFDPTPPVQPLSLPSVSYMHDDVQYFAPGPAFPWANTQAATQRARMKAMGLEVPAPGVAAKVEEPAR